MLSQQSTSLDATKIVPVQWLRGIAATMVVVHHAVDNHNIGRGMPRMLPYFLGFSSWSFGVDLFFLVSGFIIVTTAKGFGEPEGWHRFLKRRLVRIVPMYWLVTTVMVAIAVASPATLTLDGSLPAYILKSYAFIPAARTPGDIRPLLGQGWSLNFEMMFYVVFALAMLLSRWAAVVALTVGLCLLVWLGRNLTPATPLLFSWTHSLMLEFLFGVWIGVAYREGWRLPRRAAVAVLVAGIGVALLELKGPVVLTFGLPATAILMGCVLGPPVAPERSQSWAARIGDASYSIYLTHTLVQRPLWSAWAGLGLVPAPRAIYIGLAVAASTVAGVVIHRFVELPMTEALRRRFLSRAPTSMRSPGPGRDGMPAAVAVAPSAGAGLGS